MNLLLCRIVYGRNKSNLDTVTALVKYFQLLKYVRRYFHYSTKLQNSSSDSQKLEIIEQFEYTDDTSYFNIDVDTITRGNPEKIQQLKLILLEVSLLQQQDFRVPRSLSTNQWLHLLSLNKKSDRSNYVRQLWCNSIRKERHKLEQEPIYQKLAENKKMYAEEGRIQITTNGPILYNLFCNSLFTRIREKRIDTFYNYKLFQAMTFNPTILIDCQYEPNISNKALIKWYTHIMEMWSENRQHSNPHHLIFCCMKPTGRMMNILRTRNPCISKLEYPFFHTPQSYLDLFPRERLIYLMPNSRSTLTEYNANDVYILGGLTDHNNESLTYAVAKREGLRTAKLPLDLYLQWGVASKNLNLNTVVSIMNDVKDTGDWKFAFRHLNKDNVSAQSIRTHPQHNTYDMLLREISKMKTRE